MSVEIRGKAVAPGGLAHTGFQPVPDDIRYFVSTGKKEVRGGAAEYLKANPDLVERCFKALGKVTPPGKYLIVQACETLPDKNPGVRSVCCFGTAEQIRNMAALVHFDRDDPFSPVIVPGDPPVRHSSPIRPGWRNMHQKTLPSWARRTRRRTGASRRI